MDERAAFTVHEFLLSPVLLLGHEVIYFREQ